MQDTGLTSFWNVIGCLFCIILAVGAILFAQGCMLRDGLQNLPPVTFLGLLGLVIIILAAVLWLVRELFPAWLRVGRSATVLKEVMEIEGKV